jgi:hypothetical protein
MTPMMMLAMAACTLGSPQVRVVEASPRPRFSAPIAVPGTADRIASRTVTTTVETRRIVRGRLISTTTTTVTTEMPGDVNVDPIISASH